MHCSARRCITLHCIASHINARHFIALQRIALQCIALQCCPVPHSSPLHIIPSHSTPLQSIPLHSIPRSSRREGSRSRSWYRSSNSSCCSRTCSNSSSSSLQRHVVVVVVQVAGILRRWESRWMEADVEIKLDLRIGRWQRLVLLLTVTAGAAASPLVASVVNFMIDSDFTRPGCRPRACARAAPPLRWPLTGHQAVVCERRPLPQQVSRRARVSREALLGGLVSGRPPGGEALLGGLVGGRPPGGP